MIVETVRCAILMGQPLHEYVAQNITAYSGHIESAMTREYAARSAGKSPLAAAHAKALARMVDNQHRMVRLRRQFASWRGPAVTTTESQTFHYENI